jgi:hypothetical protein
VAVSAGPYVAGAVPLHPTIQPRWYSEIIDHRKK